MIHETAWVDPAADLASDVEVGPFSVIGPNVSIGAGAWIGPHVVIQGNTRIGPGVQIFQFASVGAPPQDKKYGGGATYLEIGADTIIRESATLHLGTEEGGGVTRVGSDVLVMAYVHVAHDCQVGDHVVLSNAVTLAGHVTVGEHAIIGGMTAVHQFCHIGPYAFVGGASAVSMDVPPFASVAGNRARLYGPNTVGLDRAGFSKETVDGLKRAFKALFHKRRPREQALAELEATADAEIAEVRQVMDFLRQSERGVVR
ncbi:UDP-N-acetylglucosamine acyltransferase [Thiohalorhabdus denitrificans]|uniref:Acyl-[acyl-carrier-protein]--UDP-N-acetylglucosamine O-acyltransferase n=1 Tax=Thiohalorhabdus denitrificans TaxID=381306 RepID=A0A0P9GMS6_9GAMM|nr:acyl-ACP--UDP-N-acetylglucosamine O-acyltransferase [Thiohalorhabdus denitrificans]KPV41713.1 UDP-N-acetylglucosamine acyltransferase [Thiohalorhabdus denitrificans]SCY54683.1 acyl-[acyl-carrier-protein]--UDP-N-acetylglucosamine O-acyltransferase [Thiohalorhabdus denitrificans]